jgi:hypothetical protein
MSREVMNGLSDCIYSVSSSAHPDVAFFLHCKMLSNIRIFYIKFRNAEDNPCAVDSKLTQVVLLLITNAFPIGIYLCLYFMQEFVIAPGFK